MKNKTGTLMFVPKDTIKSQKTSQQKGTLKFVESMNSAFYGKKKGKGNKYA